MPGICCGWVPLLWVTSSFHQRILKDTGKKCGDFRNQENTGTWGIMPNYKLCGAKRGQNLCLGIAAALSLILWAAAHAHWGYSKQLKHCKKTKACCALLQDHVAQPSPYSKPQLRCSLQLSSHSNVTDKFLACVSELNADAILPSLHQSASQTFTVQFNNRQ